MREIFQHIFYPSLRRDIIKIYNDLSGCFLSSEKVEKTVTKLNAHITKHKKNYHLFFLRAKAFKTLGRLDNSLSDINESILLKSYFIEGYRFRIELKKQLKDELGAYQDLKILYDSISKKGRYTIEIDMAFDINQLGIYERRYGNVEKALEYFTQSIEYYKCSLFYEERARTYLRLNQSGKELEDKREVRRLKSLEWSPPPGDLIVD